MSLSMLERALTLRFDGIADYIKVKGGTTGGSNTICDKSAGASVGFCYSSAAVLCRLQLTAGPGLESELHISMEREIQTQTPTHTQTQTVATADTAAVQRESTG